MLLSLVRLVGLGLEVETACDVSIEREKDRLFDSLQSIQIVCFYCHWADRMGWVGWWRVDGKFLTFLSFLEAYMYQRRPY
jgi:hypothetical protein